VPELTRTLEPATRKKLDTILTNLGWHTDEHALACNVFTGRAKITAQDKLLAGNDPDYLLYESGTDNPIAVIEAKRSGGNLKVAQRQAVRDYATPLNISIVFVSDGTITETFDRRTGCPLRIDGDVVTDLLTEKTLLRFVREGTDIRTPEHLTLSKKELIRIFAEANDLLRKEGLRKGIERFTEFSNLLFLKLISEIEDDRERRGEKRILEARYCWDQFYKKDAPDMIDYINDTILPKLVDRYNHSGDVFQSKLLITNPETLKKIIDKLTPLKLLDTDSDIKGDAFEYFLKNSVTVGNDLGEYFTPRHIVKLIVELVNPKFGETVYDPCCGTGGFLIEAFRHIKRKVKLSSRVLRVLEQETVYGRELTATAKIAKMNMILIGDGHTNIRQMDSLKWPVKEEYNVVLTNYPFSQKTDYSNYYGFDSEDANPVFLKHVIDALKPDGRAGVVVPDGLLFDNTAQSIKIRRALLEQCNLKAVIKLHEYVFKPYTGQPTSILIFEKGQSTKDVWFFEVQDDGYKKTSSKTGRGPIHANDLLLLRQLWAERAPSEKSFTVGIDIIKTHQWKLTINEYREKHGEKSWALLGGPTGLCNILIGGTPPTKDATCWDGTHLWATISDMGQETIMDTPRKITDKGIAHARHLHPVGTVLMSFKLSIGKMAIAGKPLYTNEAIAALVPKDNRVLPKYLYYILPRLDLAAYMQPAAKGKTLNKTILESIGIPLPSRETQGKLIAMMDEKEAVRLEYIQAIGRVREDENKLVSDLIEQA
jgi:type I restriction enzyme M protein